MKMRFLMLLALIVAVFSLTPRHAVAQLMPISEEQIQALEERNFTFIDKESFFAPLRDSILRSIIPEVDLDLVKDRMSCYEATMPLTVNSTVAGFIKFFTVRKRNYTQTMLERQGYYFPIFEKYLAQYGLPDDLKYLSIVESGLKYNAKSRSGAVGLWQFMPSTGKDFRLEQNHILDERQHPELATEAACKYLKMLFSMFNDWELALAAYNCGPGTIMRAIKKTGKRNFWDLYPHLPQETRSYVPQFVAVVYSMNFAAEHNIFPDADSVLQYVHTDTVSIDKNICLNKLGRLIGCDSLQLQLLNPVAKTTFFPRDFKYPLCVPADKKGILLAYKDSLLSKAELNEVPHTQIIAKKSNHVKHVKNTTIKPNHEDVAAAPTYYKVIKGEGLYAIARKHKTTLQDLMAWNNLDDTNIQEGQQLIVKPARKTPTLSNESEQAINFEMFATNSHSLHKQPDSALTQSDIVYSNQKEGTTDVADEDIDNSETLDKSSRKAALKSKNSHATTAKLTNGNAAKRKIYQVQRGDTLFSITKKFDGLTIEQIKKANKLKSEKLKVGQTLILG